MRTAAEPGGVLPYVPSEERYLFVEKGDGSLIGLTDDGLSEMHLFPNAGGGQIRWRVFDDLGMVEDGWISNTKTLEELVWRASRLLSEFDERPRIIPKEFRFDPLYNETPSPWA